MFSLVIPVLNEEKLINELVGRVISAVDSFTNDYEIIFVDDGSTDSTLGKLLLWQSGNNKIKIISLSRNFGHQAAFTSGLEYARGNVVAMMDGDLQDPPELLGEMYRKITEEDYDIISAKKTGRKGSSRRNITASIFHLIYKQIGEIKNLENYGNFSVMRRVAVDALLSMKEKVRYLPGLRSFIGFRHGTVGFVRDDRPGGEPKMNFGKLFILATDAIFSFSRFPIRFCLIIGTLGTIIFLAAGIYVLIAKAAGFALPGWSSTLLSIYFLGSIQLVFLGVLGEYIFRNYKESQNRPLYFIKRIYDGRNEQ